MKITIDDTICQAHGDCIMAAPDLFQLRDDDDWATLLIENPDESHRAAAEQAARRCPVRAITIEAAQ